MPLHFLLETLVTINKKQSALSRTFFQVKTLSLSEFFRPYCLINFESIIFITIYRPNETKISVSETGRSCNQLFQT